METAGDISGVPFAEPSFFRGEPSAYWKPEHHEFRKHVRAWLHKNIRDVAEQCEANGAQPSDEVFKLLADFGMLGMRLGPGEHLKYCPKGLPLGIKPEDFSYWHEVICHEEVGRLACPGFVDGIGSGLVIGLPLVLHYGPDWMREKVGGECIRGEKRICLAITEPYAGSDVANVTTTATLTPDGKNYIVRGMKKWITNGHAAHYFTTLVRTGGPGMGGLSMLLIERGPGVTTTLISTSYSKSAGTALVEFKDVVVPASNLIGAEGMGFLLTMSGFVKERAFICAYIIAASRGIVSEVFKWCHQRRAFGRSLLDQPVVRQSLAKMVADLESVQAWFEQITYARTTMDSMDEQNEKLAAQVCLLKVQATRVAENIADEATTILGGRGITAGGMGRLVERFRKSSKFAEILGGSSTVLADAGIRMSIKGFPSNAKM